MTNLLAISLISIAGLAIHTSAQEKQALRLVQTIPLPGVTGRLDHMGVDLEKKRLFVAAVANNTLEVVDLNAGNVIKFDPGLKRVYVACGSGAISVFQMDDPDHYRKLEDFPVQKKVHSLAVDPETHRVYAPEQEADGKAVARMIVYEALVP